MILLWIVKLIYNMTEKAIIVNYSQLSVLGENTLNVCCCCCCLLALFSSIVVVV